MSEYPDYTLEITVVGGEYEVEGHVVDQPVVVRGTHAGAMVKDGVRTTVTIDHRSEDDPEPHLLITFD